MTGAVLTCGLKIATTEPSDTFQSPLWACLNRKKLMLVPSRSVRRQTQ